MDPLSNVLSMLDIHSVISKPFRASGDWAIAFAAHGGLKFYALIEGECWLTVAGVAEPVRVVSGDCLLLPLGRPFQVSSNLDVAPIDGMTLLNAPAIEQSEGEPKNRIYSLGGYFSLDRHQAGFLLEQLPPIVMIRAEADKSMLLFCLERMSEELAIAQPGGAFVTEQLATIMLVQILRRYLADAGPHAGWLFALSEPQIADVLAAVHAAPDRRWTLKDMAETAGMSRTAFVARFKTRTGVNPAAYVTRWRMQLAQNRLSAGTSISEVGFGLGYGSVSAFSNAFKRELGVSPSGFKISCHTES